MRKQAPAFDWTIAKNDAEWERQRILPQPDGELAATRHRPLMRYFWSVAALFLLLASAGSWWWRTSQGRTQQAAAEVTALAQRDLSAAAQSGATAPLRRNEPTSVEQLAGRQALTESQATLPWQHQFARQEVNKSRLAVPNVASPINVFGAVQTFEVQGDLAVARVVMYTEHGEPAYRQTRFYRRIGPDWRQTAPDAVLWGPERSLETPSFVYHFRQHDAPAVLAVASQVETLYTSLRRDFGLPLAPGTEKLRIEVSVTQSPGDPRFEHRNAERFVRHDRLIVASPGVYWAPVELTDAELLAQSIVLPLLTQLSAEGSEQHRIGAAWQPMIGGLQLWHVWEMALPLATWREGIVQWIYLDLPGASSNQAVVLPEPYEELCASHALWLPSPTALGIPLLCTELNWEEWYFAVWGPRHPPMRLDQLTMPMQPDEAVESNSRTQIVHPSGQTVALTTLIEYVVATYGRERLPALVAGLGQYETWDTLLPAVFGVSAAEFEVGWQTYLATHYGAVATR